MASGRSSLATSGRSGAPASRSAARAWRRSPALSTKLMATKSTPARTPNARSALSFSVRPDAGSGTPGALMPLCSPSTPPSTTTVRICWRSPSIDAQLDAPVVEQQRVAGLDERRQVFVAGRHPSGCAEEVADGDHQLVAVRERERRMVAQQAGADLGAAQVLQQRDAAAGLGRQRADARHHLAVRLVRAVREVQAEDVHAGRDQLAQRRFAARGRSDRGDDLRPPHSGSHCNAGRGGLGLRARASGFSKP